MIIKEQRNRLQKVLVNIMEIKPYEKNPMVISVVNESFKQGYNRGIENCKKLIQTVIIIKEE